MPFADRQQRRRAVAQRGHHALPLVEEAHDPVDVEVLVQIDHRPVPAGEEHAVEGEGLPVGDVGQLPRLLERLVRRQRLRHPAGLGRAVGLEVLGQLPQPVGGDIGGDDRFLAQDVDEVPVVGPRPASARLDDAPGRGGRQAGLPQRQEDPPGGHEVELGQVVEGEADVVDVGGEAPEHGAGEVLVLVGTALGRTTSE